MKDGHGRTIDYLRISLTDRCNFRCVYCMPEEGVEQLSHFDILRIEEVEQAVRVATTIGIKSVRLTGGEPTVRKGLVDLVRNIAAMPEINNVSMTTNGVLLPRLAPDLKAAGLSRVNISLDTLDAEKFHKITRCGSLDDALAGIDAALESGFDPVKINAVALRSLSDGFLDFAKLSIDRPLHVRFIEHMPIGDVSEVDGISWGKDGVISCEEVFNIINEGARAEGIGELVPAGGGPPAWLGPGGVLPFPGCGGHGGLHHAAVASFLQRVQPPAPDGGRQASPVFVLRRGIRLAHCAARGH